MTKKDEPVDSVPTDASPDQQASAPNAADDLVGALEHLEPQKPLILNDGLWVTDSGYLVSSQYVDIGLSKRTRRPRGLVKAIEAQYALEYAPSLQISAPQRFRHYGETFIQDDQEGRAQRVNQTLSEPRSYKETLANKKGDRTCWV